MEDVAQQGEPWKPGDTLKVAPKPESSTEHHRRQVLQALTGEIPNTVYESKRELVEVLNANKAHASSDSKAIYDKLVGINMRTIGIAQTIGDLYAEESSFHRDWREVQARLEKKNDRFSRWHLVTNVLRLWINTGILAVLVMYLMDMG